MNWDAVGAIAESLGALAVIISLIYLAAQVRQTRIQLRAQAEDNLISRSFEAFAPVYEDRNAQIFRKGLQDPAALNEDEAFTFRLLMDRQRGAFATAVLRKTNGSISNVVCERLLANYQELFLRTPGGRTWLEHARTSMSKQELAELEGPDST